MNDATERDELPEIPEYDPKMIRRASRRGIVRVTLIVIVIIATISAVAINGSGWISHSHHPWRHTVTATESAALAHPGYDQYSWMSYHVTNQHMSRLGEYSASFTYTAPDANFDLASTSQVRVQQSLLGHFTVTNQLDPTKMEYAVRGKRPLKVQTQAFLRGLPASTVTADVVELQSPMTEAQVEARFGRWHGPINASTDGFGTLFFAPMHAKGLPPLTHTPLDPTGRYRYWNGGQPIVISFRSPDPTNTTATRAFQQYAHSLRSSDDETLFQLGLPGAAQLRQFADAGKVYGFTLYNVSPAAARGLLGESGVRSMNVTDVQFKTMGPGANLSIAP